jgi:hypothetical protein
MKIGSCAGDVGQKSEKMRRSSFVPPNHRKDVKDVKAPAPPVSGTFVGPKKYIRRFVGVEFIVTILYFRACIERTSNNHQSD